MFDQFPFFKSHSFDEAQAIHDEWQLGLSLRDTLRAREQMLTVANVFESPVFGLYGYRYEKSVTLNATNANPDFWISVPDLCDADMPCRPASPGDDDPMELNANVGMLGLRLDGAAANRFIEDYLGEPLMRPWRIKPSDAATGPADALIARRLKAFSRASAGEVVNAAREGNATRLLEECLEALLLFRDHSHRGFVRRAARAPAPRDVRRAVDYIHACAETQPSLAELARVSGVPGRTLSLHFRLFVGASPVAYVNRVRLQNVRATLRNGQAGSVAEAALAQGFGHMGRFSSAYHSAFGEYPSQTLRRR